MSESERERESKRKYVCTRLRACRTPIGEELSRLYEVCMPKKAL